MKKSTKVSYSVFENGGEKEGGGSIANFILGRVTMKMRCLEVFLLCENIDKGERFCI